MKDKAKRAVVMILGVLAAWQTLDWFIKEKLVMLKVSTIGPIILGSCSLICLWYGAVVPAIRSLKKALSADVRYGIAEYESLFGVLWPIRNGKVVAHPHCKHLSQFSFAPNDFPGQCKDCDCWAPFKGSELEGKRQQLRDMGKNLEEE